MNLEKAFQEIKPSRSICPVKKVYDSLDSKNSKALEAAIDSNIPTYVIARTVRSEGIKLAETSIETHRKKLCKCVTA